MTKTEDSVLQMDLGPRIMQDILRALREGSSKSVSDVKVQVPLPALAELLAGYLDRDEAFEPSNLQLTPVTPESSKEKIPEADSRPTPQPKAKSAPGATLGSAFTGSG